MKDRGNIVIVRTNKETGFITEITIKDAEWELCKFFREEHIKDMLIYENILWNDFFTYRIKKEKGNGEGNEQI